MKFAIAKSHQTSNVIMPSETDVIPKAISGRIGYGLEISVRGYTKSTFGANKTHQVYVYLENLFSDVEQGLCVQCLC